MIGYIQIDREELKLREISCYKAMYCSLCGFVGKKYGLLCRFLLSYDVTFLLLLLDSICGNQKSITAKCLFRVKRTKLLITPNVIEYASLINILLILIKTDDTIRDEKRIKRVVATIIHRFLLRKLRKGHCITESNNGVIEMVFQLYRQVIQCEKLRMSFDERCNAFSKVTEYICKMPLETGIIESEISEDKKLIDAIGLIGRNIGKLIYIADAIEDYQSDLKEEKFNLLKTLTFDHAPSCEEMKARIRGLITIIMLQDQSALNILKPAMYRNFNIIENILTFGFKKTIAGLVEQLDF